MRTDKEKSATDSLLLFRHYKIKGWNIYTGKNDAQNDELTVNFTENEDLWFHAAGFAGSHVIIKRPKGMPSPEMEIIKIAASVAAWFSKARNAPFVKVHYTEGRSVYKPKNAPAGEVTIGKHRTIKVKPVSPDELFACN